MAYRAYSQVSFGHTKIGLRYDNTLIKANGHYIRHLGFHFTNEFGKTRSRQTEACFMMSNLLHSTELRNLVFRIKTALKRYSRYWKCLSFSLIKAMALLFHRFNRSLNAISAVSILQFLKNALTFKPHKTDQKFKFHLTGTSISSTFKIRAHSHNKGLTFSNVK